MAAAILATDASTTGTNAAILATDASTTGTNAAVLATDASATGTNAAILAADAGSACHGPVHAAKHAPCHDSIPPYLADYIRADDTLHEPDQHITIRECTNLHHPSDPDDYAAIRRNH